jgi:hypothetical protein
VFDDYSRSDEEVTARFEEWVEAVFDHRVGEPEWYWAADFDARWDSLELTGPVTVAYLTRLYGHPSILERYSLEQVAQGIWFLVGESSPAQPSHLLLETSIALGVRVACIESMQSFFREFVVTAAPGAADTETNPFHIACYMWWDIFPTWGGAAGVEREIDHACLATMSEVLQLPSELCQLSALHGLSHWYLTYGERVEHTVDGFLANSGHFTQRIREYAALARQGLAR